MRKAKFLQSFTLYIKRQEIYPKAAADAVITDLQLLVNEGLITRIARYDTNPANNPQPPPRSEA